MFNKKIMKVNKEKMIGVENWPHTPTLNNKKLLNIAHRLKEILEEKEIPFKAIDLVQSHSKADSVEFLVYMDRFTRAFDYEDFPCEISGVKVDKEIVKEKLFASYVDLKS